MNERFVSNGNKNVFLTKKQAEENLCPMFDSAFSYALELISATDINGILDNINSNNIEQIETNIKKLNTYASKFWLLSCLLLYRTLYTEELYKKSGMEWHEYMKSSKQRLGMNKVDISMMLSAARFFIKYQNELKKYNFNPTGVYTNFSRAEFALELSNNLEETITHAMNDTTAKFKAWYHSFDVNKSHSNYTMYSSENDIIINNQIVMKFIKDIENKDKVKDALKIVLEALHNGKEPVVIQMNNEEEANKLRIALMRK